MESDPPTHAAMPTRSAGREAADEFLGFERLRRQAEAGAIASLCRLAEVYRLDQSELIEALVERRIRPGGEGTPTVSEFLSLEVAGMTGSSTTAAASRIADAVNLRYRHPRLYQAVQDLQIDASRALRAANRCGQLHPIQADAVTTSWLALQAGKNWTAAFNALDRLIIASDTELAAKRERKAREERGVWTWGAFEGVMNITGRLDVTDARLVDDRLSYFADQISNLYPNLTHAQRRAKALGVLTDPFYAITLLQAQNQPTLPPLQASGTDPTLAAGGTPRPAGPGNRRALPTPGKHRPTLTLNVHIDSDAIGESTGIARVERAGHITTTLLAELISEIRGLRIRVQPVIDLPNLTPADAYVPTAVMRHCMILAWPHEAFPYSNLPAQSLDLDHTHAYQPGYPGQTSLDNLAPLGRRPHRAKTAGWWILEQPTPGTLRWTSPLGLRYQVTPYGTARLDPTLERAEQTAFGPRLQDGQSVRVRDSSSNGERRRRCPPPPRGRAPDRRAGFS